VETQEKNKTMKLPEESKTMNLNKKENAIIVHYCLPSIQYLHSHKIQSLIFYMYKNAERHNYVEEYRT
jgi:hypothetical protein